MGHSSPSTTAGKRAYTFSITRSPWRHCTTLRRVFLNPNATPKHAKNCLTSFITGRLNSAYSIRWLHGPAGAGKSAVMQTLCQRLEDAKPLDGSFFFKRGHKTCGNAKMLFSTLAYQLALHRHKLKDPILRRVETDPSALGRGMDVQLHTLILEPCKLLRGTTPLVLLIDGLDECKGHNIQREILRLIGSIPNDPCRHLRILVASRPEPDIRETFEGEFFQGLVQSTNIEQSFKDIHTYLRDEFSRIHREHSTTMRNIKTFRLLGQLQRFWTC
ncbi:hypothetical protein B0H19DRAFT_1327725 [Mycena capillaripes]|nr:hypothetical protein B0H19DRAFT_1327725 [Mycena capillaripes]